MHTAGAERSVCLGGPLCVARAKAGKTIFLVLFAALSLYIIVSARTKFVHRAFDALLGAAI